VRAAGKAQVLGLISFDVPATISQRLVRLKLPHPTSYDQAVDILKRLSLWTELPASVRGI